MYSLSCLDYTCISKLFKLWLLNFNPDFLMLENNRKPDPCHCIGRYWILLSVWVQHRRDQRTSRCKSSIHMYIHLCIYHIWYMYTIFYFLFQLISQFINGTNFERSGQHMKYHQITLIWSWITSIFSLGVFFGILFTCLVADKLGR